MQLFARAQVGQDASSLPGVVAPLLPAKLGAHTQMHFVCEPTPARDRNRICSIEHEQELEKRRQTEVKRKRKSRMRVRTS